MMYTFTLVKNIAISDVANITTHGEQGWTLDRFDTYHTDCIFIRKTFEEEFPSEYAVMRYFEALCELTLGQIFLLEAEGDGIIIFKDKDHCEWQMRKEGKLFRYDLNYHLFEEVKEVNNT